MVYCRLQYSRFYPINHCSQSAKRRKRGGRARREKPTVGSLTSGLGLDQNYRRDVKNYLQLSLPPIDSNNVRYKFWQIIIFSISPQSHSSFCKLAPDLSFESRVLKDNRKKYGLFCRLGLLTNLNPSLQASSSGGPLGYLHLHAHRSSSQSCTVKSQSSGLATHSGAQLVWFVMVTVVRRKLALRE